MAQVIILVGIIIFIARIFKKAKQGQQQQRSESYKKLQELQQQPREGMSMPQGQLRQPVHARPLTPSEQARRQELEKRRRELQAKLARQREINAGSLAGPKQNSLGEMLTTLQQAAESSRSVPMQTTPAQQTMHEEGGQTQYSAAGQYGSIQMSGMQMEGECDDDHAHNIRITDNLTSRLSQASPVADEEADVIGKGAESVFDTPIEVVSLGRPNFQISFSKNEIINGIVMSEILRRPDRRTYARSTDS